MMGTNTSQEIEALHRALREVGLSATIGNESQLDVSSQGEKGTTADLVQKLLNNSMAKTGGYFGDCFVHGYTFNGFLPL